MRLAHLLVLHGPHLDLLGQGLLADQPPLREVDRAIELAASAGTAAVRAVQAATEAELVEALHRERTWATHVLVSPGALAPTAYVLREALALVGLPYAEVFIEAFPDSADLAKRSLLRERAQLQRRGEAPQVYVEAAEKLLGAKLVHTPLPAPAARKPNLRAVQSPAPSRGTRKEIGRAERNEVAPTPAAAPARVAKTIGRIPNRSAPEDAAEKTLGPAGRGAPQASNGISRSAVRQRIAQRLAGRISASELATWGREQWLAVERGAATEAGQRELLAEALQALALSATPAGQLSDPELVDWMAKMG